MPSRPQRPPVFISAPIAALVEGLYREDTTIGTLRAHGDFGLGTFNDLDGEMVIVDGIVYRLPPDGPATIVGDDVQTPFAIVTRFEGDAEEHLDRSLDADAFEAVLADLLPSRNLVYAIRIDGRFRRVRARSVPKQANYRPLAEIARVQTVFEFDDVEGTIVGFWTPSFLESVHVPGFHLHFITADRSRGGHVLAAEPSGVLVRQQHVPKVELGLPITLDFLTMDRTRDLAADIAAVER
mgnify:CR=1 FL=1